uniref:ascorbate ferrireductase (transmembrane) n=1 Tax=Amblyomma triste TaxID=251400 RepID=A0A023G304_AMBTT
MANRASGSRSAAAGLAASLLFAPLVLYAVGPDSSRLFPWHPTLLAVAFGLVTQPAVLLARLGRIRLHWALQATSTACALLGVCAAYAHKSSLGKPHFATWHAQAGIAALVATLLDALGGAALMLMRTYGLGKRYPWLKPGLLRRGHRLAGVLTHGIATTSIVLGLRSHYGRETLEKALPAGHPVAVQLALQVLVVVPFAAVAHQVLWPRYDAGKKSQQ